MFVLKKNSPPQMYNGWLKRLYSIIPKGTKIRHNAGNLYMASQLERFMDDYLKDVLKRNNIKTFEEILIFIEGRMNKATWHSTT